MKKILLAALAATALFASCNKDNGNDATVENTQLTVKISGVIDSSDTRAVEAPGTTTLGTIQLTGGHIFVINPLGAVIHDEAMVVASVTGAGQILTQSVPADSRVYIVGNIPAGSTVALESTIADIKAATALISTQSNYREAALANSTGNPVAIVPGASNTATVNVSISPLISRLELVEVRGGSNVAGDAITGFTVTGVYIDDYYPSFTFGGSYSGTIFSQGTSTTFLGLGDSGSWAASSSPLAATPGSSNVWAHNVASGGVVRLLIELTDVKYKPNGGSEISQGSTKYYLTVTGYTGVATFERGKIYRIGSASNTFTFTPDDLGLTPNPTDVQLTVNVTIDQWQVETPNAIL